MVSIFEKMWVATGSLFPTKDKTALTESEIKDLLLKLKAASPDLIYPVVFLLAHTGARLDEILTLKWKDVNFENGTIQLLWTKNGEDRLIQVSDEVLAFLGVLRHDHENVVVSQYKKAWTHSQYRKQFNKFRRKINFHLYWCNHVLRHSFATNYLKQGNDMLQLQQILGHKTLQMVKRYAHLSEGHTARVVESMNQKIFG